MKNFSPVRLALFLTTGMLLLATAGASEHYGAALTLTKPFTISQALNEANSGKVILVEGEVGSVCTVKGCWLSLQEKSTQGDKPNPVRVTFKDYGFFVPPALHGKTVQVEGTLQKVTLSLKDSKHFVKDGGGDPELVTEPITEFQMIAAGVRVVTEPL